MKWIKANPHWVILNLFALGVTLYLVTQGELGYVETSKPDPMLSSGKWGIRFLLICLMMTPLNTYFGWRKAIVLRKPAGLWAFGFTAAHLLYYLYERGWDWLRWPLPEAYLWGIGALFILSLLATTSNRGSMRRLKKNWKRLHRLVYIAAVAGAYHALLTTDWETALSKKIFLRDPDARIEAIIHLVLLSFLLAVRLPFVRRLLKKVGSNLSPKREPSLQN